MVSEFGCVLLCLLFFCVSIFIYLQTIVHGIHSRPAMSLENFYTPILQQSTKTVTYPDLISEPPENYPTYTSLASILERWNPDNPDPPNIFHESLQHFNYSNPYERSMSELYRNREIPFKLYNVPEVTAVTNKWSTAYLARALQGITPHVEKSNSNHFLFWNMNSKNRLGRDYIPPTEKITMPFEEWLHRAHQNDLEPYVANTTHYYYMAASQPGIFICNCCLLPLYIMKHVYRTFS